MTGMDFQEKLDAIVEDLQTKGKGQTVNVILRNDSNAPTLFPLSSDANGVVNVVQLGDIQTFIDGLKPLADSYTVAYEPVKTASEAFRTAREAHQPLIDAAATAREALATALEADDLYQDAKSDYDQARNDPAYIAARDAYQVSNVSENFGNLSDAKGKYVVLRGGGGV